MKSAVYRIVDGEIADVAVADLGASIGSSLDAAAAGLGQDCSGRSCSRCSCTSRSDYPHQYRRLLHRRLVDKVAVAQVYLVVGAVGEDNRRLIAAAGQAAGLGYFEHVQIVGAAAGGVGVADNVTEVIEDEGDVAVNGKAGQLEGSRCRYCWRSSNGCRQE